MLSDCVYVKVRSECGGAGVAVSCSFVLEEACYARRRRAEAAAAAGRAALGGAHYQRAGAPFSPPVSHARAKLSPISSSENVNLLPASIVKVGRRALFEPSRRSQLTPWTLTKDR